MASPVLATPLSPPLAAHPCGLRAPPSRARVLAHARFGGAACGGARVLSRPGRLGVEKLALPASSFGGARPELRGGEASRRGESTAPRAFESLIEQINADPVQFVAGQLFALSLFPYLAFLYYLTKSKKVPGVALFGFYFLLFFVFATIPASIYAQKEYGTVLANVDWLHGTAESMLTLTNLFVVVGFRQGIRSGLLGRGARGGGDVPSSAQE